MKSPGSKNAADEARLRPAPRSSDSYARLTTADGAVLALAALLMLGFIFPPQPADATLPSMEGLRAEARKEAFFGYLEPIVANANESVRQRRRHLLDLGERIERGEPLSRLDRRWIERLAERYEVPLEDGQIDSEVIQVLKRRVDIVPQSLVLGQAAKESGWGRSRFATEANNLFGQRCYDPGCGIVPQRRGAGAVFEVTKFDSIRDSVDGYLRNLNTHPQHRAFRELRASLRSEDRPLNGVVLADGLTQYSERRGDYVEELQSLIIQNDLEEPAR